MSPRQGLVRGTLTYLRRDLREIVAPTSLPDNDDGRERVDGGGDGDDGGIDGDASSSFSPSSSSRRRFARRLRAVASGVSDYYDSWKKPIEENSKLAAEAEHEKDEDDAALREAAGDARDALASASRQAASAAAKAAATAATATGSEALRPAPPVPDQGSGVPGRGLQLRRRLPGRGFRSSSSGGGRRRRRRSRRARAKKQNATAGERNDNNNITATKRRKEMTLFQHEFVT